MSHYQYLFNRFIDKAATPAELEEFYNVMREIDPANAALYESLEQGKNNDKLSDEEKRRMERIFHQMLKKRNLAWQDDDTIISINRSLGTTRWWLGAAAAIAGLTAGVLWYSTTVLNKTTRVDQTAVDNQQPENFTFHGPDFVRLPDNSTVVLRKGSELSYSSLYGQTTREVSLKGEGFFDVKHDPKRKFTVRSAGVTTSVLGTAFNVKVSENDYSVAVSVARGKVAVADDRQAFGTITKNEQLIVNTKSNEVVKSIIDVETVTKWQKNYFILDKITFIEAADLIGRRFNVKVTVTNKSLHKCFISAWFMNNESLDQVLKAVCTGRQATYTIDNDNVTIMDGRGCD